MPDFQNELDAAAAAIRQRWSGTPRVGMILGTGLGKLAEQISAAAKIAYAAIPYFPRSTAIGHRGQLLCGTLRGVPVVAMEGRCHLYEGYTAEQLALPVRVMRRLGIEVLIVSNASGGLNPRYRSGDILMIEDHINLMNATPPANAGGPGQGLRLPACQQPYDRGLLEQALAIARRENLVAHLGTYVALSGPSYETRAEYRFLRRIGGDVVGMSTAPEAVVAARLGLRVLGLSIVTNLCLPDAIRASSGEEVVAIARTAEAKLSKIVLGVVAELQAAAGAALKRATPPGERCY